MKKTYLKNVLENIFVLILAFYPLRHIAWGLDLWDTGYNYANFQYMGTEHMDSMWLFSTYLANAVGRLLTKLPNAGSLLGMNLYTGLFVSILALTAFFFCCKVLKMPLFLTFVGELAAISMCWCPTALLYNYLTYLLLLVCMILLYQGLTKEKKWCLFAAGVCLGANVLVRFSNLPEAVLILAVWGYDWLLFRERKKADSEEEERPRLWPTLLRHTLWCLLGYLAALAVLFGYIHLRYGMGAYVEGIGRLFAMTDVATDYKAASMLRGVIGVYVDHLYWVKRIGILILGGMAILFLSERAGAKLDHALRKSDARSARLVKAAVRILVGLLGVAAAVWLYRKGLLERMLWEDAAVWQRAAVLAAVLGVVTALAYCLGARAFSVLLGVAMLCWLWFRGFCSTAYYSYDSILRPAVLFLMLAMLIAVVRILYPKCTKEEKLIGMLVLLIVAVTSIGSNTGVFPSMNNLFVAAPYVLCHSWGFLRKIGEVRIRRTALSSLPAKGMLAAFLVLCLFQFGMFGQSFVFAEATGVRNPDSYVENNPVLKGIRMSGDKASWLSGLSEYINDKGLAGQEVILYGNIPALSYYLQMPAAFNSWSDLDSYSREQMETRLEAISEEMKSGGERPVVIAEKNYALYLAGGSSALRELADGNPNMAREIEEDQKWLLLVDFMEENGYEPDYSNEKFTVFR